MTPLETLAQLGPIATGVAATVALVVGVATVRQRDGADQREQWWKRAQWVFDQTWPDGDEGVNRQYVLLSYLAASDLAGQDEQAMLDAFARSRLRSGVHTDETDRDTITGGPERDVR